MFVALGNVCIEHSWDILDRMVHQHRHRSQNPTAADYAVLHQARNVILMVTIQSPLRSMARNVSGMSCGQEYTLYILLDEVSIARVPLNEIKIK